MALGGGSGQVPPCPGGQIYEIKPGDSYFGLARRFSTTIQALMDANPGVDPQNLQLGMRICIPVPPSGEPCPGGFPFVIRPGNTFFSIARRFGIAVAALAAANPGVNPLRLRVGQTICVPAPRPIPCPSGQIYTIVAGDTLFSLAQRFNTTVDALIAANPGIDPNSLQVARMICIPD